MAATQPAFNRGSISDLGHAIPGSVVDVVAGACVDRVGITFVDRPPLPFVPMIVKHVKEDTWAHSAGIQAGLELLEINEKRVGTLTDDSFKSLITQRPLRFKFGKPREEECKK